MEDKQKLKEIFNGNVAASTDTLVDLILGAGFCRSSFNVVRLTNQIHLLLEEHDPSYALFPTPEHKCTKLLLKLAALLVQSEKNV